MYQLEELNFKSVKGVATMTIKIDNAKVYRELKTFIDEGVPVLLFRNNASFETHVWTKQHPLDFANIVFGRDFAYAEPSKEN